MSPLDGLPYREIWCVDYEFHAPDGERPEPICMAAREARSGRLIRCWEDEFPSEPPYRIDDDSLFVAFYASAELGCHLALNWPMPRHVLDLSAEFRASFSGLPTVAGKALGGALVAYGLDAMSADEKSSWQGLAVRGGPWTAAERAGLLDYCQADADALVRLLPAMLPGILGRSDNPTIALGQALLRGRYMAAAARMEWRGVPIDLPTLTRLRAGWEGIKARLVAEIDGHYGIFDGLSFRQERFAAYLERERIPWPRLPTGHLELTDRVFKDQARSWPAIAPLRELRYALSQMRLGDLKVGADARNRCVIWAFAACTSRNAPSTTQFVFGASAWLRGLIRPPSGFGVAYVDWRAQEVAIAAQLSGDQALLEAYNSGDVYLSFAKQAGLAPPAATKASHGTIRDLCKTCVLGINYGMEAQSLSWRTGLPLAYAKELLDLHRKTYPRFWAWSDAAVNLAMMRSRTTSVFGWPRHVGHWPNLRAFRNFAMQANGAEMLRLACSLATEAGLGLCCPIHDAVLLEAPLDRLEEDTARLRACMAEASGIVLGGLEIGTDANFVRYPARYSDKRGAEMWQRAMRLLAEAEADAA